MPNYPAHNPPDVNPTRRWNVQKASVQMGNLADAPNAAMSATGKNEPFVFGQGELQALAKFYNLKKGKFPDPKTIRLGIQAVKTAVEAVMKGSATSDIIESLIQEAHKHTDDKIAQMHKDDETHHKHLRIFHHGDGDKVPPPHSSHNQQLNHHPDLPHIFQHGSVHYVNSRLTNKEGEGMGFSRHPDSHEHGHVPVDPNHEATYVFLHPKTNVHAVVSSHKGSEHVPAHVNLEFIHPGNTGKIAKKLAKTPKALKQEPVHECVTGTNKIVKGKMPKKSKMEANFQGLDADLDKVLEQLSGHAGPQYKRMHKTWAEASVLTSEAELQEAGFALLNTEGAVKVYKHSEKGHVAQVKEGQVALFHRTHKEAAKLTEAPVAPPAPVEEGCKCKCGHMCKKDEKTCPKCGMKCHCA